MPLRLSGHRLVTGLLLALAFLAGFGIQSRLRSSSDAGAQPVERARAVTPRGNLTAAELSTIDLFREASPSVVYITTLTRALDRFSMNTLEIPRGSGSGFVWDGEGHIVTNAHVLAGANIAQVTLDDQHTYEAEVVGHAVEKDLAVLKISADQSVLRPLPIGRSDDLQVGQNVYAIGNPFGLDHTLTTGVISAVGREIQGLDRTPIQDVIQTDAAINPGNSGGPLLDSAGRLIGVNTQIYSPSGASAGIGFAIPVDTVNWVVPDLIAYGRIRRPLLEIYPALDSQTRRLRIEGVLIIGVEADGAAERAGLQGTSRSRSGRLLLGDVIVAIDDEPIRNRSDLTLVLEKKERGQEVRVRYKRNGEEREARVTLSG